MRRRQRWRPGRLRRGLPRAGSYRRDMHSDVDGIFIPGRVPLINAPLYEAVRRRRPRGWTTAGRRSPSRCRTPTGAVIADGEATGTIENADPMPSAWLVRFGRTVGSPGGGRGDGALRGAGRLAPDAGRPAAEPRRRGRGTQRARIRLSADDERGGAGDADGAGGPLRGSGGPGRRGTAPRASGRPERWTAGCATAGCATAPGRMSAR